MHNLGQTLKHLITQAKLSENELSRRTGVPQQVINRILTGKNLNPKIATLSPLADYFTISITQLLGEEGPIEEPKLNIQHLGWAELSLIEWGGIGSSPLESLRSTTNEQKIAIDITNTGSMFATRMIDNSMEPKFSQKTLLIFDSQTIVRDKDFVLIFNTEHGLVLRQIFIKKTGEFQKCFNPKYQDYKLAPILAGSKYVGVLMQSRTNHRDI